MHSLEYLTPHFFTETTIVVDGDCKSVCLPVEASLETCRHTCSPSQLKLTAPNNLDRGPLRARAVRAHAAARSPIMAITRISKACDGCRVRKVRCGGEHPCRQCEHLSITCVFSRTASKRRAPVRGRLVAQLRDISNGSNTAAEDPAASPVTPATGASDSTIDHRDSCGVTTAADKSPYTAEFFHGLVPDFEEVVYTVNPVITPAEIRAAIDNMSVSCEDSALVHASAAATIDLAQTSWRKQRHVAAAITDLVQHSLTAHRQLDVPRAAEGEFSGNLHVSVKRIMTCVFLQMCMMALKHYARGFALIREAIAMLQVLNHHDHAPGEPSLSRSETARRQRLYWEIYIHERYITMTAGYPSILTQLREASPLQDVTIPRHVDVGFSRILQLFCVLDEAFLQYWSNLQRPRDNAPIVSSQWIEGKQVELDMDEMHSAEAERDLTADGEGGLTEIQLADLLVTRLWLRTLIWQLALSHGLLRSAPPRDAHQGLSLHFPAKRLSSELRSLVCRLESVSSIATHGVGILQKLFEITNTVADVLALPLGHGQTQEGVRTQMEDFVFLVRFLFSFERIQKKQRDYLRDKLEQLQKMYTVVDFGELASSSPDA